MTRRGEAVRPVHLLGDSPSFVRKFLGELEVGSTFLKERLSINGKV